jgi:hypothetical protein
MKRSLIAVCLLLLSANSVMACVEEHNTGAGWFDQQPSGWASYGTGAQTMHRDRLLDVALFTGGLGALILVGVAARAVCRAPGRAEVNPSQPATIVPLALPMDVLAFAPMCAERRLVSEDHDWSCSQTVDVHSNSITGDSPGIDCAMSIGMFTSPAA